MYCECKCGRTTAIYRGKYRRFISGHNGRGKPKPNPKIKGEKHFRWKRGRIFHKKQGYWFILIPDGCFSKLKRKGKYIREHIYVFEQYNQCCMLKWGAVHHIDHNKEHNMPWNLQGMTKSQHKTLHNLVDTTGRKCLLCNSEQTLIESDGGIHWYKVEDGWYCKTCYDKNRKRDYILERRIHKIKLLMSFIYL